MEYLKEYEQYKELSVCFCILYDSDQEEEQLYQIQRELSEGEWRIRQNYVYGDQTVNASKFFTFRPDCYTKVEKTVHPYPAQEALVLAAGMLEREAEQFCGNTHKSLLLILGEEAALRQQINHGGSYEVVKNWVMSKKDKFDIHVIS